MPHKAAGWMWNLRTTFPMASALLPRPSCDAFCLRHVLWLKKQNKTNVNEMLAEVSRRFLVCPVFSPPLCPSVCLYCLLVVCLWEWLSTSSHLVHSTPPPDCINPHVPHHIISMQYFFVSLATRCQIIQSLRWYCINTWLVPNCGFCFLVFFELCLTTVSCAPGPNLILPVCLLIHVFTACLPLITSLICFTVFSANSFNTPDSELCFQVRTFIGHNKRFTVSHRIYWGHTICER